MIFPIETGGASDGRDSVVHLALLGLKCIVQGGKREHERRRCRSLLLLLPCLDYGCSRCKCVSEPLTNTNAGIKGQQQQSRHTRVGRHAHTHSHASHTHTHTRARALSLLRTHWRSSPPRAAYGQGAPRLSVRLICWKENIDI